MNTIKLQIDQNEGPLKGFPIAPSGWVAKGAVGTTDNRFYINPTNGTWVRLSEIDADGNAPLYDPPAGWQSTETGHAILALGETPYNTEGVLHKIVEGKAAPLNPEKPLPYVPGRTMAQAQALGDVWGFSRDPNAG